MWKIAILSILFVLGCFGLGILLGYLDNLKFRTWDDYFKIWLKKYCKKEKKQKGWISTYSYKIINDGKLRKYK
jgi:hypothetical protein